MECRVKFMDELPQELLQNLFVNWEEFETYLARNDNYSLYFICRIFKNLIGYSLEKLANLFESYI